MGCFHYEYGNQRGFIFSGRPIKLSTPLVQYKGGPGSDVWNLSYPEHAMRSISLIAEDKAKDVTGSKERNACFCNKVWKVTCACMCKVLGLCLMQI